MLTAKRLAAAALYVYVCTILPAAAASSPVSGDETLILTGTVDGPRLRAVADSIQSLRRLDLSATTMTSLPAYSLAASAIEEIILPESLTAICEGALAGTPLRSLTIPAAVSVIEPYALSGCTALETIEGGSALRVIGEGAMRRCTALRSVPFPSTLDSIGPSALRGSAIVSADLSRCTRLASIGEWAMSGCLSLESISLPGNMRNIGRGAFFGDRALSRITIASGLDSISDFAFAHASSLSEVDASSLTSIPALGSGTWHGTDQSAATLTVLESMLDDFAATPGWNEFHIAAYSSVIPTEAATAAALTAAFAGQQLRVASPAPALTVTVYSTDGRLRRSYDVSAQESPYALDASALNPELYIIAVTMADGSMSAVKARK